MPLFNGYIAVDWSASSRPVHGTNSIWIAIVNDLSQVQFENPHTRHEATSCIESLLKDATRKGRRLLCGFDFPFGYPAGTAQRMTSHNNWKAVWKRIAKLIVDEPNNQNNRFDVAAKLNQSFKGEGPFWGNGLRRDIRCLPRKRPTQGWGENHPAARRYIDLKVPMAQEVWKLSGAGSVGSQALLGIPSLEKLRHRADVEVWPFETLGEGQNHVVAEIYPSLIQPAPGYYVLDQRQVHAVAVRLQALDTGNLLEGRLYAPKSMPAAVRNEEGLFLDIT